MINAGVEACRVLPEQKLESFESISEGAGKCGRGLFQRRRFHLLLKVAHDELLGDRGHCRDTGAILLLLEAGADRGPKAFSVKKRVSVHFICESEELGDRRILPRIRQSVLSVQA